MTNIQNIKDTIRTWIDSSAFTPDEIEQQIRTNAESDSTWGNILTIYISHTRSADDWLDDWCREPV